MHDFNDVDLVDEEWELGRLLSPNEKAINIEHLRGFITDLERQIDRVKYYDEPVTVEYLERLKSDLDFLIIGARP